MRRVALTGTPGTGKSTVEHLLAASFATVGVDQLARRLGCARETASGLEVDLDRLVWELRNRPARVGAEVVVGHLAHLLPIRDVVVLRCHPLELDRRLSASRRTPAPDRHANLTAEAIGVITAEAAERRRRILEVDTTGRSARSVAQEVGRWARGRRRPSWGSVDWLADASVTEHLLEWAP